MPFPILKAPFPWFGGKSRVAPEVWDRFGHVDNYVEPFAGSLAVLLGRPTEPNTETVNDLDCYLANFWRALSLDPEGVAEHADWPVNEADLHARHLWLVNQIEFRERMKTDPEFYDLRIAGWWVWGLCQWIGSGWCSTPDASKWNARPALNPPMGVHRKLPQVGGGGRGINRKRPMVHGGHTGKGIHAEQPGVATQFGVPQKIPHLGSAGMGVNRVAQQLPELMSGRGVHSNRAEALYDYFYALQARLRRVRVCCGDWQRVLGPSVTVKHGVCGVFLDPPYAEEAGRTADLYAQDDLSVAHKVREWAIENGNDPLLRIAVCGYEGEHTFPDNWECLVWKAAGGYGGQRAGGDNENAKRERIWFSPHCLRPQANLFFGAATIEETEALYARSPEA